jgi:hypothetical protein
VSSTGRHRLALLGLLAATLSVRPVGAQNSIALHDFMLLARGGALGGQALAGDLLGLAVDPSVASGPGPAVEMAGGTHALGLEWAAVGARLRLGGRPVALLLGTLSYGEQRRTALDDRLGVFGGSFTPGDAALSVAVPLLEEGATRIGAGATLAISRIDGASAFALTGAVAFKHRVRSFEVRGGLANAGVVLSPFASGKGTRLPVRLRAGGAWSHASGRWEVSSELLYRAGDRVVVWGSGGEWRPHPQAVLRVGLIHTGGVDDATLTGGPGAFDLTLGMAWQIRPWRLSYVWRPGGLLGDGHLLALGWNLGPIG